MASALFQRLNTAVGVETLHVRPAESYKILLLGETCSGKTSFVNFLWNSRFVLELNVKTALEKFRSFNNLELENPTAGLMQSKTSDATLYTDLELVSGMTVDIIDTPGFGDAIEDKRHVKKIVDALKDAEFINCICLVINGTCCRMTATLTYVLMEVTSILPKVVLDNVIVVFTNVANSLYLNFSPDALQSFFGKKIEEDRMFFINNPYCLIETVRRRRQISASIDRFFTKNMEKVFHEAKDMLIEMCDAIKSFRTVHTMHFVTLYDTKLEVEQEVTALLAAYESMEDRAQIVRQGWLEHEKQKSVRQPKTLSELLLSAIKKFEMLSITRNYTRVLRSQLAIVEHHLEGDHEAEFEDLRKTKEEIEKKIRLVEETLSKLGSYAPSDLMAQKQWACGILGVNSSATREMVEKAFRDKARLWHPDKPGGDEEHFKRVQCAKDILMKNAS